MELERSPFRIEPKRPGLIASRVARLMERVLGLTELQEVFESIESHDDLDEFVAGALRRLDVQIDAVPEELDRIPKSGPVVAVANHPLGGIDGLVALALLRRVRPDVRVLANSVLARIDPLKPVLIPVDPFGGPGSERRNVAAMRSAIQWVRGGGALLVFPAGEVAHRTWTRRRVADPAWQPSIARIVARCRATVTPMFLGGANGRAFQLAGLLHPRLRTVMLPRQMLSRVPRRVPVRVGHPIAPENLERFEEPTELVEYLRLRTEILARRLEEPVERVEVAPVCEPIADAIAPEVIQREVDALPAEARVVSSGAHDVFLVTAEQIPQTLLEIGRLRETAFRAVGEGTGRPRDNDEFDRTYRHLFVWHRERRCILGAYRLGLTDELGREGLYTGTLFDFDPRFIELMSPAIELGRSFVRNENQRSYLPLMLLWRGIGAFVSANPQYHKLFGPVSISASYDPASLQLILDHLRAYEFRPDIADWIRPRNPVRPRRKSTRGLRWTPSMLQDLDQVSSMVAEIERDEKGIPVLVREYLKLGGKVAGFNVDNAFGDAVDGLMIVDLHETPIRLLNRYLGTEAAESLLAAARNS